MCPGGYVVGAASETGSVVTNGMSEYARDGQNSNAALLVGITPEDFGSAHPLAGIAFQRKIERAAFEAGGEASVSYTHLDVYKRQALRQIECLQVRRARRAFAVRRKCAHLSCLY